MSKSGGRERSVLVRGGAPKWARRVCQTACGDELALERRRDVPAAPRAPSTAGGHGLVRALPDDPGVLHRAVAPGEQLHVGARRDALVDQVQGAAGAGHVHPLARPLGSDW